MIVLTYDSDAKLFKEKKPMIDKIKLQAENAILSLNNISVVDIFMADGSPEVPAPIENKFLSQLEEKFGEGYDGLYFADDDELPAGLDPDVKDKMIENYGKMKKYCEYVYELCETYNSIHNWLKYHDIGDVLGDKDNMSNKIFKQVIAKRLNQ